MEESQMGYSLELYLAKYVPIFAGRYSMYFFPLTTLLDTHISELYTTNQTKLLVNSESTM